MNRSIEVVRARVHNLKAVSVSIPHGMVTAITGVSGSGKSSLAFDTLYAEGQGRFVASMSTYARQFLERVARPDVDRITNILPAIAIEQTKRVKNARSTVGTATEINDFLRLLFARIGTTICPHCRLPVTADLPETILERLAALTDGARLRIMAPVECSSGEDCSALREKLLSSGFHRLVIDGDVRDLEGLSLDDLPSPLLVLIDRLVVSSDETSRLRESIEAGLRLASGRLLVGIVGDRTLPFDANFTCNNCGDSFPVAELAMFSFNSSRGACPECEGFGRIVGVDFDKVIPDRSLSMRDRPVACWNTPAYSGMYDWFEEIAGLNRFRTDVPIKELTARERRLLYQGKGEWIGINGFFEWLESKRYKVHVRVMLSRFRSYTTCPACQGTRLRPEALQVCIGRHNIGDLCRMNVAELMRWCETLPLTDHERLTTGPIIDEIRSRLKYLVDVGLSYLTLDRQTRTLSGGETMRISLASAIGSCLTNTLYVLDEPTVGLHARDCERLVNVLSDLKAKGNTTVVVEHDPTVICGADKVIDLGPAAGEHGGRVVFEGTPKALMRSSSSVTGKILRRRGLLFGPGRSRTPCGFMVLRGARQNNLKNLTVNFPVGVFACVTGVSGSGKTTLVQQTLYAGYKQTHGGTSLEVGLFDALDKTELVSDVVMIDQNPIGRSKRSNTVTYVKAYDPIRRLMAETRMSQLKGLAPGYFSFNVPGGRCDDCAGVGSTKVDMYFLADITVTCQTCGGKRFKPETLEIQYKGKSIVDILEMTVSEAMRFFKDKRAVVDRLAPLADVGLGYLRLGQDTGSLSAGEAQRLKLAGYLGATSRRENLLLIFDEPTTGLHLADIAVLVDVIQKLVDAGNSVLIVEHNLDLIAQSDYVIDLGPEGGDAGGCVVASGPPRAIMSSKASQTGVCLKKLARANNRGGKHHLKRRART